MKAKKIYFLLCLLIYTVNKCVAQVNCPPANIGFESGSFQNWDCGTGSIRDPDGVITLLPSGPVYDRHTIIDKNNFTKFDFYGKFPTLCPNGSNYSIRLGNQDIHAEAEQVSYTFTIGAGVNNYSLFFNYAVVLQNPGHSPNEQPRFTAKVYNLTDTSYIDCASFDFIAGSSLPGFIMSKEDRTVYYKDWATANINLQGYAGKQIRVEFTTNDCSLGGHFGYAYLDLIQGCVNPITGNAYCTGQTSVTLSGPSGFNDYRWYDAAHNLVGSGQALHLSPPPLDNTPYSLVLTPLSGLGCVATLQTVVNKIDAGFKLMVVDTLKICPHGTADLTASAVTAGSISDLTLTYSKDPAGGIFLYNPQSIADTGTYYIKAVNAGGCTNTFPVVVSVADSIVTKTTNPAPVVYPITIDLANTFKHTKDITYTYYKDKIATEVINQNVGKTGTYYIKSANYLGCNIISAVSVIVDRPADAVVNGPNAFTPNGDGINDYFFLTINGYEDLTSLRIYNRYGKQVFETKAIETKWDGTINGQAVATGTYYWVYEGTNAYDGAKTKHGGSVTIVR